MATITGLTAERMLAIEAQSIVDGAVVGDNLILTRFDSAQINAGSVRGPTGSPGITEAEMLAHLPINCVVEYIGVASPSVKWLTMVGQTVANAQSLYPTWWARIPASMKSGSSAIMPDTRGKVSVGYDSSDPLFDTIGEVGGNKTHQLAQVELPNITITIDPPNTAVAINDPGHVHHMAVYYPGGATSFHGHEDNIFNGASWFDTMPATTGISASVNIAPFQTAPLGSAQAFSIVQPYVTFLKIVKVA